MCDVNCVAVFNDNYKYLLRVRGGGPGQPGHRRPGGECLSRLTPPLTLTLTHSPVDTPDSAPRAPHGHPAPRQPRDIPGSRHALVPCPSRATARARAALLAGRTQQHADRRPAYGPGVVAIAGRKPGLHHTRPGLRARLCGYGESRSVLTAAEYLRAGQLQHHHPFSRRLC